MDGALVWCDGGARFASSHCGTMKTKLLLAYASILLIALVGFVNYLGGCADQSPTPQHLSNSPVDSPATSPTIAVLDDKTRGRALFAKHCAPCHGPEGRGDGEFASMLNPPARDFGRGNFKITSTASGLPTDEDLYKTLRRGMLPSLMPPRMKWAEADLRVLLPVIREMAVEGYVADQLKEYPTHPREET